MVTDRYVTIRSWRVGTVILALMIAAGCVGNAPVVTDTGAPVDVGPSTSTAATGSLGSTPGEPSAPTGSEAAGDEVARIRLAFAGDVSFEEPRASMLSEDPGRILRQIAPILGDADLTVVNLETALTTRGTPADKAFTFRTGPAALDALAAGGVDVASMANNHGLDFGLVGVDDALAASAEKGFPLIGIGRDEAQAMAPFRSTIRGHRVAVIAATQVIDDALIPEWTATPDHPGLASAKRVDALVAAVRTARPSTDTLVVFLHWGVERQGCPSSDQMDLARRLADAGADIIVGSHAHRLLGMGTLDGAVVHYGLGNFAFYAGNDDAATTGVLSVEIGGGEPTVSTWHPARIDGEGIPHPVTGSDADRALAALDELRSCTDLDP